MLEPLFNKVEVLQVLRTPILETSANDCLVRNMYLNTWELDQGAIEMFISEFEDKESLCNVMSKIFKNGGAKKKQASQDCLNYPRCVVINSLFACYFVSWDSIFLILK